MKNEKKNNNLEVHGLKNQNIKYPFFGIAPNLIDKFLVLGYQPKQIEIFYLQNEDLDKDTTFKTRFRFFDLPERPSVVNEICNNYIKDLLENDLVLELVFPNLPKMYFLEKQYVSKKENDEENLISPYTIVFSLNPQDNSGSKKSYNGLGYVFFHQQEHKNEMNEIDGYLYVPVAYVILSEYPYFYHFNEICKEVLLQIKKENDEIPIDIILYNLVKYCPSPINTSLNLSFGALLGVKSNTTTSVNKIIDNLNIKNEGKEENNGIPTFFFNQLSGYPFLDFNLSFIFNLIPPEIVIEVFIFSFLEHDIIFYSTNPELLNMVMFIFSNLNYPFNDSIYYWHILSVSQDSFMSGSSTFVGKTCSTITGILNKYDSDVLTTKKISEHFVLDIDKKNFFFLFQEETKEVKETIQLYEYIKNCTSDFDEEIHQSDVKSSNTEKDPKKKQKIFNDGIHLYDSIYGLMEEIMRTVNKVTRVDYNLQEIKPSFFNLYQNESEMECMKSNSVIQKAFFTFITQIIQNFISNLRVEVEKDNEKSRGNRIGSIVINIDDKKKNEEEDNLAKNAGIIFKKKFKDSSKYSSFVINFCQFHDTVDLYKISYTFINEFIYYSHAAGPNFNYGSIDLFKLIDQFYGKRKMINFALLMEQNRKQNNLFIQENEDENENEIENVFSFSFNKFGEFYDKNLRAIINREQEDDKDIFIRVKNNKKAFKTYKRNGFFLSNKILNYYINFAINNNEILKECFKLIKCPVEKRKNDLDKLKEICNEDSIINDFEIIEKECDNIITVNKISALIKDKKDKQNININEINNNKNGDENKNEIIEKNGNEKEDKNEYQDYYSIKMENKKEKELLFYGGYELTEISNVIERHFILQRIFSSYGLIKFSLLNILAVTRGMEGQKIKNETIVKILCDFCEKTKSLVRKYMNIYLNIFGILKVKNIIKDKEECDKCLNIITRYFIKTKMIPTEETTQIINSNIVSSLPTNSQNDNKNNKENDNINNIDNIDNIDINLVEKDQFFNNQKRDDYENALKIIEAVFSGTYEITKKNKDDEEFLFSNEDLDNAYKELIKNDNNINNKKTTFIPETPLSLYNKSSNILNKYLTDFSYDKKIYKELGLCVLSLLYYFKIPIISLKWVDQYTNKSPDIQLQLNKEKNQKKIKEKTKEKIKEKEKQKEKEKEKEKQKEKDKQKDEAKKNKEKKDKNELNKIINNVIFILSDLFKVIITKNNN